MSLNNTTRYGSPNTDNTFRSAYRTYTEATYSNIVDPSNISYQPNSDVNLVYYFQILGDMTVVIDPSVSYIGDQLRFILELRSSGVFTITDGVNTYTITLTNQNTIVDLVFSPSGYILITSASGGSGTPGGNDTDIQVNNSGAFGGDDNFQYDGTNLIMGSEQGIALQTDNPLYFNGTSDPLWNITRTTLGSAHGILKNTELAITIPSTLEGFSINNEANSPLFQINGNSTGAFIKTALTIGSVTYPASGGTAGQVLIADGIGGSAFGTQIYSGSNSQSTATSFGAISIPHGLGFVPSKVWLNATSANTVSFYQNAPADITNIYVTVSPAAGPGTYSFDWFAVQ